MAIKEGDVETEKRPDESKTEQPKAVEPKQNIGDLVGELVVSGATVLANTAAKAVVSRVKKAAAKARASRQWPRP